MAGLTRFTNSTRYGPARMDAIIDAARKGWTPTMVSNAGGITVAILKKWLNQGLEELENNLAVDDDYIPIKYTKSWFYLEFESAAFNTDIGATNRIQYEIADPKGDWKAAAWWLEKRQREYYGKEVVQRHVGHDGGAIQIKSIEIVTPRIEGVGVEVIDAQAYEVRDET